jgi:hypothetical protein
MIIPVELDGDSRDELLFYSASTGTRAFYDVDASGGITRLG